MRQLCLSADLIPANYVQDLKQTTTTAGPAVSAATLSQEERDRVIEKLRLAVADQEECSVGSYVVHWSTAAHVRSASTSSMIRVSQTAGIAVGLLLESR